MEKRKERKSIKNLERKVEELKKDRTMIDRGREEKCDEMKRKIRETEGKMEKKDREERRKNIMIKGFRKR